MGRGAARCGRSGHRSPTHAVDITDTFDAGVASLEAHRAYIDGLGWEDFDPRSSSRAARGRPASGSASRIAAPFEVFPLGWG